MAGGEDTPQPSIPKIDSNSPFFLGPQDRPGDFITAARFNGENYDDWARGIETALHARRKFGFLDGSILSPSPPCTATDWVTIHAMLVSWIMNTIIPEVKSTLSKYKDAKRLWDTLKERFAQVNGPRIQPLKSVIANCRQSRTMTVAAYYEKLTALWEKLYTHEPLITCACCAQCTAGRDHEIRCGNDKLHEFLMGLCSDYYGQLRSHILAQDPLPSLNRAYQLVTQDERVRTASAIPAERPEAVGFSINTEARGPQRSEKLDRSKLQCTHCKKNGHDVTQCFLLIGFPDKCTHCKKRGHTVTQCYEKNGYPERWAKSSPSTTGNGRGSGYTRANVAVATPSTQVFSVDQ